MLIGIFIDITKTEEHFHLHEYLGTLDKKAVWAAGTGVRA
jgi:hypothetical protein